jgi:hypothetical protein
MFFSKGCEEYRTLGSKNIQQDIDEVKGRVGDVKVLRESIKFFSKFLLFKAKI